MATAWLPTHVRAVLACSRPTAWQIRFIQSYLIIELKKGSEFTPLAMCARRMLVYSHLVAKSHWLIDLTQCFCCQIPGKRFQPNFHVTPAPPLTGLNRPPVQPTSHPCDIARFGDEPGDRFSQVAKGLGNE